MRDELIFRSTTATTAKQAALRARLPRLRPRNAPTASAGPHTTINPQSPTSVRQLDTAISNVFAQLEDRPSVDLVLHQGKSDICYIIAPIGAMMFHRFDITAPMPVDMRRLAGLTTNIGYIPDPPMEWGIVENTFNRFGEEYKKFQNELSKRFNTIPHIRKELDTDERSEPEDFNGGLAYCSFGAIKALWPQCPFDCSYYYREAVEQTRFYYLDVQNESKPLVDITVRNNESLLDMIKAFNINWVSCVVGDIERNHYTCVCKQEGQEDVKFFDSLHGAGIKPTPNPQPKPNKVLSLLFLTPNSGRVVSPQVIDVEAQKTLT